ncbi:MAG: hypothetical protein J6I50_07190 [Clostridia bacterium]|nr:hypothetical protein [Clostridia bacterium]
MKKIKITALLSAILFVSTMIGCDHTDNTIDTDNLDKYIESNHTTDIQYEIPSWLTPEEKYQLNNTVSENNIVPIFTSNYKPAGDRLYYRSSTADGTSMWAYISMTTGESHLVCPDPLCKHTADTCQYLNFSMQILVDENDNTVFYTLKTITAPNATYTALCRVDTANDMIKELYRGNPQTDREYDQYIFNFISKGKIYFTNIHYSKKDDGNGNMVRTETPHFMYTDIISGETVILDNLYIDLSHGEPRYADEAYIYFLDQHNKRFYATDYNFENERDILTFEAGCQVSNLYYDKKHKMFYLSISADEMDNSMEAENTTGYICRIDENLSCEKLNMPSNSILKSYLTDDYIYYTVYDPISYGTSPRGGSSIDADGGKIYRVSLDSINSNETMQVQELVFDGEGKLFLHGSCFIINDYMYTDYYTLVKEGGMTWFRNMDKAIRINLKEKTIKWLILQ